MADFLRHWRQAQRDRRAADWVIRIDEDPTGNEAGLRRWVGHDDLRAQAYNRAYRAFHGASSAARQLYPMQTQRERPLRVDHPKRHPTKQILAIAFTLVLASAALYFMLMHLNGVTLGSTSVDTRASIATHIGEVRPVRLADGSRLLLDTNSEIRIDFSGSARRIDMIRGRTRFDVAHDPLRPFSVVVGGATITDRGTVFDVEAYRDVRVRLISGAIDVAFRRPASGKAAASVHLVAGQQLRFGPALTASTVSPTASPTADAQWVSGMKTFDDVPVRDILEEVNRYSTSRIVLADPSLATHRVFLDLDIRDTSAVADNLATYLHLSVDASLPGQLILRGLRDDTPKKA
jgi:transmembrane sensor